MTSGVGQDRPAARALTAVQKTVVTQPGVGGGDGVAADPQGRGQVTLGRQAGVGGYSPVQDQLADRTCDEQVVGAFQRRLTDESGEQVPVDPAGTAARDGQFSDPSSGRSREPAGPPHHETLLTFDPLFEIGTSNSLFMRS